ncbi:hypothetical protein QTN47_08520 [Danxiaibacter flavus]|uniref:Uncharacterized protein n=1 Tax=Danxiaibacter flavus TaxID=3049108 RepID=A0ABV3ZCD6_9BACT|nr:hypothetical protein QNM32_08520 [Chitinophagaceae bacterium DXS]
MKKIVYIITISLVSSFFACNKHGNISTAGKTEKDSLNSLEPFVTVIINSHQNKYGDFGSAGNVAATFPLSWNINSVAMDGYQIQPNTSTSFFSTTDSKDTSFERKLASFVGNKVTVSINGNGVENIPAIPAINFIDIEKSFGDDFSVSKSTGASLKWDIRKLIAIPDGKNLRLQSDPINIPNQPAGIRTYILMAPFLLETIPDSSRAQYFEVPAGSTTFTIPSTAFDKYKAGEFVNIKIASASNVTGTVASRTLTVGSVSVTDIDGVTVKK